MSSSLREFSELVNGITDPDILDVAEGLLRDMIAIEDMKERIEKLEESLSEGDRATFWFFAMDMDREQIDLAANKVIGRKRVLVDRERRALAAAAVEDGEAGEGS